MSRVATSHASTVLDGHALLGAISVSALSPTRIARHLARTSLAAYVITQIVTQCSTLSTSITTVPWQNVDMACKAFCIALALTSLVVRKRGSSAPLSVLLAAAISALFLSAGRTLNMHLFAGFIVIASQAGDDWEDLCLIHCRATLLAVVAVMLASLAGVLGVHDFIPNGRLVFGYGFTHPNTLGGLLFSAAGSLTCARWRRGAPILPLVLSGCCTAFSYVALSSNAASVLCGAVFAINAAGLVAPKIRRAVLPRPFARLALLVVPAALLALSLAATAHYDGSNALFAALNHATHSRPFFAHEYYEAVGGFATAGAPALAQGSYHAGTAFWGVDSGYSQLGLIYGLAATCALAITYAVATWRASARGVDVPTAAIILACALYLAVEPFPLFLHLSFVGLFLAQAFAKEAPEAAPVAD